MLRSSFLMFAVIVYAIFFATFLYLIAFVGDLPFAPMTVNRGPESSVGAAVVIDLALIALFGVQHSVMARQGFKRSWTRIVPKPVERSVYVLAASLMLMILFAFWRPIEGTLWDLTVTPYALALWALFGLGWAMVLLSTFLLNHFELFGLQQTWFHLRGREAADPVFRQPFFYKWMRHPLYSGFFLAFWATPVMTFGHLLLAAGMSVYMLIGIAHEERDLVDLFGDRYVKYREDVGMLAPGVGRRSKPVV